jgi:hypothetical protein
MRKSGHRQISREAWITLTSHLGRHLQKGCSPTAAAAVKVIRVLHTSSWYPKTATNESGRTQNRQPSQFCSACNFEPDPCWS